MSLPLIDPQFNYISLINIFIYAICLFLFKILNKSFICIFINIMKVVNIDFFLLSFCIKYMYFKDIILHTKKIIITLFGFINLQ